MLVAGPAPPLVVSAEFTNVVCLGCTGPEVSFISRFSKVAQTMQVSSTPGLVPMDLRETWRLAARRQVLLDMPVAVSGWRVPCD